MKTIRAAISVAGLIVLALAVPASSQYLEYMNSTQWGGLNHMEIDNDLAYCGFTRGLLIYDISNSDNIRQISQLYTGGPIYYLAKSGDYIYAPVYGRGLRVIDISDPYNPEIIGAYDDSTATFVAIEGYRAYLASMHTPHFNGNYSISAFNVQDPSNPQLMWQYEGEARFRSMAANDGNLYIVENSSGMDQGGGMRTLRGLFNAPTIDYGRYETSRYAQKIMAYNNQLYFLDNGLGLSVMDMSAPYMPRIIAQVFPGDTLYHFCRDFTISDDVAYALNHVAADFCYLSLYDVSDPSEPSLIDRGIDFESPSYEVNAGNGLAFTHDEAYDFNPRIQIIDVTDPEEPVLGPNFKTAYPMREIALLDDHLIAAHSFSGFSVLNKADIDNVYLESQNDTLPSMGHISLLGNYAVFSTYNSYSGNLYVYDLSQPASPEFLANYHAQGSIQDMAVIGNYAYLCIANHGLEIVDLTSPNNPYQYEILDTVPAPRQIVIENDYAYFACGQSGLMILDVADPAAPSLAGYFYRYPINILSMAIRDSVAYLSDSDFLTIVDISDPSNITLLNNIYYGHSIGEIAFLDNYMLLPGPYNSIDFYSLNDPAQPEFAFNSTTTAGLGEFLVRDDDIIINEGTAITFARFHQTAIDEIANIPSTFGHSFNYPKPFNAKTSIHYSLSTPSMVNIDIYDILGRKVHSLANRQQSAGYHIVNWDASGFSSGIYFYKITSNDQELSGEMLLLK